MVLDYSLAINSKKWDFYEFCHKLPYDLALSLHYFPVNILADPYPYGK